jgi:hypothetical protein
MEVRGQRHTLAPLILGKEHPVATDFSKLIGYRNSATVVTELHKSSNDKQQAVLMVFQMQYNHMHIIL